LEAKNDAYEATFGKIRGTRPKEFKTDIFIKQRKCTHTVQIADELSENILGIDFLQKFRLYLNPKTKEITFQSAPSRALFTTKNLTIPPFSTMLVQARTFENINKKLHYIAGRHWGTETTPDIRTFHIGQLRPPQSMHNANPKLRSTRDQH
jgi:hypothetical protein